MLQSQITALQPLQNAHEFEHGCSYAVEHKEVRERSIVHSAFSSVAPCSLAFRLSVYRFYSLI